ncbi:helix-turn-helix domain-containing protein [Paenibacillus sp. 5J-6]|uniref:Helix-turn-helix domain-containing protein n=1 Tax=Paenibacillus silvestris TaxID=2606219 RepID=A0A6L8V839_9BACL|nr:helix-turn-helix domain-containing protein [Paenibacillus silvestris]MZQ86503.1 helix-turn-helix domain-containing protein [Paenibacillus silvestris]
MNAIIVDDEPYVRQMLKSMIHWDDLSLHLAGEFFNGQDAYNWMKQDNHVDLVITDLRMPIMDGLQLIRDTLAIKRDITFLVISAFNDFHLVKEAFLLGAKDYLLKSEMTEDHINHTLSNLRLSDRQQMPAVSSKDLMKETLLSRLAAENLTSSDISTLRELLCNNEKRRLTLLLLRLNKLDANVSTPEASMKNAISECLSPNEEILASSSQAHVEIIQTSPYEYLILTLYAPQESEASIMHHLRSAFSTFRPSGFRINLGVSRISSDFSTLPQLLHEARLSVDYCFVAGNGSIIPYTSKFEETPPLSIDSRQQVALLKDQLSAILFDKRKPEIHNVIITPQTVSASHIRAIKELYMKYHFFLMDFAMQNGLYGELRELSNTYEEHLKFYGDLDSLNKWLSSVIAVVKTHNGENSMISQVKHYVEENYMHDISLQSVANKFNMNSSYLSRLFSEKRDTTFTDYLAHTRMTKAIEFMKSSNLKIYEICEKVGYTSPEHFSRTFKKLTGKSPKQFMDGHE